MVFHELCYSARTTDVFTAVFSFQLLVLILIPRRYNTSINEVSHLITSEPCTALCGAAQARHVARRGVYAQRAVMCVLPRARTGLFTVFTLRHARHERRRALHFHVKPWFHLRVVVTWPLHQSTAVHSITTAVQRHFIEPSAESQYG